MDAARRKEVLAELTSNGYAASYLDTWPPKVTLYRHKPGLNTEGTIVFPVGSMIPNQPGHPDHAARKSRYGWLPWLPSDTCKCKACRERATAKALVVLVPEAVAPPARVVEEVVSSEPKQARPMLSMKCVFCDFVSKSTYKMPMLNKLKAHVRRAHVKAEVPA